MRGGREALPSSGLYLPQTGKMRGGREALPSSGLYLPQTGSNIVWTQLTKKKVR
jgi:hypothetical protein